MVRATVSIFSTSGASSSYRKLKSPGSWAASTTARARSSAPAPPSAKWLETADRAPARQPGRAALHVGEPVGAHVHTAAGLGDEVGAPVAPGAVRDRRRVAGRGVADRTSVHERGRVLQRVQQVRLHGVADDDG